jgi:hypothetical protein
MDAPLLPIEVIERDSSRSVIDTFVYQYPAIGTKLAFPEKGKFAKYEVVDVIQMVARVHPDIQPPVPPRVLIVVTHERDLNI